jgi:hypothetical protein
MVDDLILLTVTLTHFSTTSPKRGHLPSFVLTICNPPYSLMSLMYSSLIRLASVTDCERAFLVLRPFTLVTKYQVLPRNGQLVDVQRAKNQDLNLPQI